MRKYIQYEKIWYKCVTLVICVPIFETFDLACFGPRADNLSYDMVVLMYILISFNWKTSLPKAILLQVEWEAAWELYAQIGHPIDNLGIGWIEIQMKYILPINVIKQKLWQQPLTSHTIHFASISAIVISGSIPLVVLLIVFKVHVLH